VLATESKAVSAQSSLGGDVAFVCGAYADNYLVDLKNAVIMDVEATSVVRQAEVGAAKTTIDRTVERLSHQSLRNTARRAGKQGSTVDDPLWDSTLRSRCQFGKFGHELREHAIGPTKSKLQFVFASTRASAIALLPPLLDVVLLD
jgi:hypothetical protein